MIVDDENFDYMAFSSRALRVGSTLLALIIFIGVMSL